MDKLRSFHPIYTPLCLWEEQRDFLTVQKIEPNCQEVFLQVPQEGWEVGAFGTSHSGRERPGETSPSSCPWEFGPFLPIMTLQACRPALLEDGGRLFFTRRSALRTAPKCLLRGPGRFPISSHPAPTLPAAAAGGFGGSYRARPQQPQPRINPHPSPLLQEARAQDFHLPVAPGQLMQWSRDAGAGLPRIASRPTPDPFSGKDQHQPPG